MNYGCVLTEAGQAQIANALALGQQISLTQMAVGDGGGEVVTPDATMTALVGEKYKADVNRLTIDPNDPGHVIVELVIPSSQGGWTIREVGLFDVDGNLVAVGNTPESYKPTGAEGSLVEQTIRAHLRMTEASAGVLQLKIDPTIVLSTRQYVDEEVATRAPMDHGHPEKADVDHDHPAIRELVNKAGLIITKVFSLSGVYEKPVGLKALRATVIGAGAGGSGSDTVSGSYGGDGGAGGGGSQKTYPADELNPSEPFFIGLGGPGGPVGQDGIAGGTTSFKGISATGGQHGHSGSNPEIARTASPGKGEGGDLNLSGETGGLRFGQAAGANGDSVGGKGGGPAFFGGSTPHVAELMPGEDGTHPGMGGSGGGAPNQPGGAGYDGLLILEEFF